MVTKVNDPYPVISDLDGTPLENGYIYIGEPSLDPEAFPKAAFWDQGQTIPATQPVRTIAGRFVNLGSQIGNLYVEGGYSILAKDKNMVTVFSAETQTDPVVFFGTIAAMAAGSFGDGDYVEVRSGFNGEPETFRYDASSTLTADGALVVDATGMGVGRLVSTRKTLATVAELLTVDLRGYETYTASETVKAGWYEYTVLASGATGRYLTTAGGVKLQAKPDRDGYVSNLMFDKGLGYADAFQSALDSGHPVRLAAEAVDPVIDTPIILPERAVIKGPGRAFLDIQSEVVGDDTFKIPSGLQEFEVSGFSVTGNGLTGAAGNGHCFALIDPDGAAGTHYPQSGQFQGVVVRGFRGTSGNGSGGTIPSCGVCQNGGLAVTYAHSNFQQNGIGILLNAAQNTNLLDVVLSNNDRAGGVVTDTERVSIIGCDMINNGDGGSLGDIVGAASLHTGNLVSAFNEGFSVGTTKFKNTDGKAQWVSYADDMRSTGGNWFRASPYLSDVVPKSIYAYQPVFVGLCGDTYSPSVTGYATAIEEIEIRGRSSTVPVMAVICGNTFGTVGQNINYRVGLTGDFPNSVISAIVENNHFGSRGAAAAATVTADVRIAAKLTGGRIRNNCHQVQNNVTNAAAYSLTAGSIEKSTIGPNDVRAVGGVLTASYVGMTESVLNGSVTWDIPSLAAGADAITTITVVGAAVGDRVSASISVETGGGPVQAWVSSTNTVSVQMVNASSATIDPASATVRVAVERAAHL